MTVIRVNGQNSDNINVLDRGLQYGDGLFETMAVIDKKVLYWPYHWDRLNDGCNRLAIPAPDKAKLEQELDFLCQAAGKQKQVIKIILTRGVGQRGALYPEEVSISQVVSLHDWPAYPETNKTEGIAACYCDNILSENPALAGLKHLNRLDYILARNEWTADEFQEGLISTQEGLVVDGTMSNIFAVQDKMLFTPDLSRCGVSGVMRRMIIEFAKQLGYPVYEKTFSRYELEDADELFLTNSLFGIWPVRRIGKTQFLRVGEVTQQLQQEVIKSGLV